MDPNFRPTEPQHPSQHHPKQSGEGQFPDRPPVPFDHHLPQHGTPDHVTPSPSFTPSIQTPQVYSDAEMPTFAGQNQTIVTTDEPKSDDNKLSVAYKQDDKPVPVVRVLSVRGVEYAMMSILLWFWAGSLITVLVSIIMGGTGFTELAFPVALMVVAMPMFSLFYIRLRRAELRDPSLRLEASKRRFSQITQIVAFLTCFFNLVALAYVLISSAGGNSITSLGKFIGATAATLAVAGGILAYYWLDEHKLVK